MKFLFQVRRSELRFLVQGRDKGLMDGVVSKGSGEWGKGERYPPSEVFMEK